MAFVAGMAEEVAMMALALVTRVVGIGAAEEEVDVEDGLTQAAELEVATGAAEEETTVAEHSSVSRTHQVVGGGDMLTGPRGALGVPRVAVDADVARYTGGRPRETLTTTLGPCCSLGEGGCSKGCQSQQR